MMIKEFLILSLMGLMPATILQPGGGPFAQRTPRIYACVVSNQRYIVGGKNPETGLLVSQDLGRSWKSSSWPNIRCFAMAMDPTAVGRILYLASGNGVLKTTNGGQKWRLTTDWRITEVQEIELHPRDSKVIYIGTPYGVFKSTDGAQTWVVKNRGLNTVNSTFVSALLIDRQNPERLLIGTEEGLYQSTDGAGSWHRLALEGKPIRDLAQNPQNPQILYAATEDDGLFRSTDGGKTWHAQNKGLKHRTVYDIAIDPIQPEILYLGTFQGGVYKSTDGGRHWRQVSRGLTNRVIHSVAVYPLDHQIIFAGSVNGGIFRSDDGGRQWVPSGLEGAQIWEIEIW